MPKIFTNLAYKLSLATLMLLTLAAAPDLKQPLIYLRPNETPLFTELYQRYGLLNPPALHVYDSSLYLGQPGEKGLLIPSSEAFFNDVEETIRAYQTRIGIQELFLDPQEKDYVFCPSNGSLQTIFALVYAIANSDPTKKFLFVEKRPFYSFHEHAVNFRPYVNAKWQGFDDPSEIKAEADQVVVEFVTSPNNPDGKFRKPYTKAKIIIADFVFASPSFGAKGSGYIKENLLWVREARKEKKHIFAFNSVSKALGRPGSRLGYMWFQKSDPFAASIFRNFFSYEWKLTVGTSTPGVADSLNLISALLARPDAGQSLRTDAFKTIAKRHHLLKTELLKRFPGTEVTSIDGSPTLFARLKSPDMGTMSAEAFLFKTLNVAVDNGQSMGMTDNFIRINVCGNSGDLAEFLNRLANNKKYSPSDLLISSENHCTRTTLRSSDLTHYVANPNDCTIDVDATHANVQITLPPFINYQQSNLITITKLDSTEHLVKVQANKATIELKKKDEALRMQWTQAFFLNGQWQSVKSK